MSMATKNGHEVAVDSERRRSESNRRMEVLQTSALPLGYGAGNAKSLIVLTPAPQVKHLFSAFSGNPSVRLQPFSASRRPTALRQFHQIINCPEAHA